MSGRLFVPEGADDRRPTQDYKATRVGYVVDPKQPESPSGVELVTFSTADVPS